MGRVPDPRTKVTPMSADPNKKSGRTFQCRDVLWETFEQMARELECSVDYLINEAMKQYARQRSYGGASRTPFPGRGESVPQQTGAPSPPAHLPSGTATPLVPPPPAIRPASLGPPVAQRMQPPPMMRAAGPGGGLPAPPPSRSAHRGPALPPPRGYSSPNPMPAMPPVPGRPPPGGSRSIPPPIPRSPQPAIGAPPPTDPPAHSRKAACSASSTSARSSPSRRTAS
jgi:hypothetical protein